MERTSRSCRTKPVQSYMAPNVTILESPIHGRGMFASSAIPKGQVVFVKGGHILTRDELFTSSKIDSHLPIADDLFIAAVTPDEEEDVKLFLNHSCRPSCGIRGDIVFVALRKLAAGEELTCDYATIDNEDYEFVCNCGAECCRRIVTGFDWKKPEIQRANRGLFARYLADRIAECPVEREE